MKSFVANAISGMHDLKNCMLMLAPSSTIKASAPPYTSLSRRLGGLDIDLSSSRAFMILFDRKAMG